MADSMTDPKRKKMPRPIAVADILANALRGKPLEKRLKEGRIWLIWDDTVGAQIAAKARPASFRSGVLTVMVASAPWMQQLTFLKSGIIEKLNARLGEELVQEIYLRAGKPEALHSTPPQPKKQPRSLSATERLQIAEQTANIDEPGLRSAFARLLARHLTETKPSGDE